MMGCQSDSLRLPSEQKPVLRVLEVEEPQVHASAFERGEQSIVEACRNWRLSPTQVTQFFTASEEFPDNPYSMFSQLPCSISGTLESKGTRWRFAINAGATATWQREGDIRYFGCSAISCEPLVLLMPNPEGL